MQKNNYMDKENQSDLRDPTTNKRILEAYRRLIAALLKNSIQDAKRGDLEAASWLRSEGVYWLDWLQIKQPEIGVERLLNPVGKMVVRVGGTNG